MFAPVETYPATSSAVTVRAIADPGVPTVTFPRRVRAGSASTSTHPAVA